MPTALDHVVLVVPDLDEAVGDLARSAGVVPVAGGSHPGMGTRNAVVGLVWRGRRRAYLELLGPDPGQPPVPPEQTMLGAGAVWAHGPCLHGWAVEAPGADFDRTLERARRVGLDVGDPVAARRRRPDGTLLSWRLAAPYPLGLGGVQPFLIDWQGGAHPSDADLPWLGLRELRLQHPDPVRAREVLHTLSAQVAVEAGPAPRLTALLKTPNGDLELR